MGISRTKQGPRSTCPSVASTFIQLMMYNCHQPGSLVDKESHHGVVYIYIIILLTKSYCIVNLNLIWDIVNAIYAKIDKPICTC